jgi:hypothetical protein
MLKKLALGSLLLSSSLFAAHGPNPGSENVCIAVENVLQKMEAFYMPADRNSCKEDSDCSFLATENWKRAQGINKNALAGYQLMTDDPMYQKFAMLKDQHCMYMHPAVIFDLPDHAMCKMDLCVPIWKR